ncbi:MAG TPA: flagellar hook-length control protein FliK [Cerasibacillus sp.]|uniref:flagellar hook-length control protein FliK n=1 Tax=Cerasibacillus sp. TaxID=2498711 RepID=UPI002F424807
MIDKLLFTNHFTSHNQPKHHKNNTETNGNKLLFMDNLLEAQETLSKPIQDIDFTEQLARKNSIKEAVLSKPLVETDQQIFDMMDDEINQQDVIRDIMSTVIYDDVKQIADHDISPEQMKDENETLSISMLQHLPIKNVQPLTTNENMTDGTYDLLYQTIEKIAELITKPNDEQLMMKAVALVKEWLNHGRVYSNQAILSETMNTTKALEIWQQLVRRFEQRDHQLISRGYGIESRVTTSEITKWLSLLITNNMKNNEYQIPKGDSFHTHQADSQEILKQKAVIEQPIQSLPPVAMSNVEQYIVHVNHGSQQHNGVEIIKQLEKIINVSQFMIKPGKTQLSISFRPENLGEMMLRFTQINGETTVKIVVTTQVAQKALEANMHQLKHLFMPHQVVIERQDMAMNQTIETEQEAEDFNQNQHEQEHNQSEQQKESSHHFETELEQFLNEKV